MNLYNDHDPYVADWLRNLVAGFEIPAGIVDSRDIRDIQPEDLLHRAQVHLFAGIAGWPLALELAGWSAHRPVWTVSCPCPPFSLAGKKIACVRCNSTNLVSCVRRTGYFICASCGHAWEADDRHLWPEVWRLVAECRPPVIFGEQVESPAGRTWLAGVRASLEILGYAVAAATLPASFVGAPHARHRIWWAARKLADQQGEPARAGLDVRARESEPRGRSGHGGTVVDADRGGLGTGDHHSAARHGSPAGPTGGISHPLGDSVRAGRAVREGEPRGPGPQLPPVERTGSDGDTGDVGNPTGRDIRRDGERRPRGGEGADRGSGGGVPAATLGDPEGQRQPVGDTGTGNERPTEPERSSGRGNALAHANLDRRLEGADEELGVAGPDGHLGDPRHDRRTPRDARGGEEQGEPGGPQPASSGAERDPWTPFDLVLCSYDDRPRRIEPGTFPLASGVPERVDKLRAYGNSIVPQVAAVFIKAYLEVE